MLYDDNTASQTYELYGPKEYSMAEIADMVDKEIFTKRRHLNVPRQILEPAAKVLNRLLWWPMLSAEQVQMEHIDQVIDYKAKTFKDLGIEPGDISKFTYQYVVRPHPLLNCSKRARGANLLCSKDSAAERSTTCRQRAKRRSERRGSTCTFWMINEVGQTGVVHQHGGRGNCKYATRFSGVFNAREKQDELKESKCETGVVPLSLNTDL